MPPAGQHKNEWVETMNNLGIDVGKKKCRAALKDERGESDNSHIDKVILNTTLRISTYR
jgi:hypothetical protein